MKRVAVIGYGGQGAWHCTQIQKSDALELTGTYDINENRRNAAKKNGIYRYHSNEEIFADKNIDIIVIATPNDTHKDLVIQSLKTGHNTICEKPVALSVKDFRTMVEAEQKSGKLLSVHQNRRWDTDFLNVKKAIDSGEIGRTIRIESRIQGSRGIPSDWRTKKVFGGGMLYDWGVHLIDQMLQLITEKIVLVNCVMTHITNEEVDDGFRLELTFNGGKTAYIEVSTYNFLQLPRFYMQCDKGTLCISDWQHNAEIAKLKYWIEKDVTPIQNAAGITRTMAPRNELTLDFYESLIPKSNVHEFYLNFCDAIDAKAEQIIKNAEVERVLKVIESAFASAEQKQTMRVEI